eukprot:scaffold30393_cov44-Phaeocystis_antarctica.AAC.2
MLESEPELYTGPPRLCPSRTPRPKCKSFNYALTSKSRRASRSEMSSCCSISSGPCTTASTSYPST